ncbi:hypothetical protein [Sphingobacterium sp.]|uniref:hypothetical protein n=1 Tax=Sphingobacterium sp. TaxID=341027 RepID=UPI0031D8944A
MKINHKVFISLLGFFFIFLQACQKGELYDKVSTKIVEVTFSGSTSVALEFVYNNVVLDSTKGASHSFPKSMKVNIAQGNQKIQVREKGKTTVLRSYQIDPAIFNHQIGILYDNGKIYDKSIFYNLYVNPIGRDIEFFIDGKIVAQTLAGGQLTRKLEIPLDKDQKRELSVKIKGKKEVIFTKTLMDADSNKTLKFLLDGEKVLENLTLPALKNSKGMSLTFKLNTVVEFGQSTFLGGDVDLLFYMRDQITEEVTSLKPEIRVPVLTSFVSVELPPLPEGKIYTYDVVRRGTTLVPYTYKKFVSDEIFPVLPNKGRYGRLGFFKDLTDHIFLPGERIICRLSVAEEQWGDNYDEIFIVPGSVALLNDFVTISN